MGNIRQTKLSANKQWIDTYYNNSQGCTRPTITFPLNETLMNGNFTGCLAGDAVAASSGVILTPPVSDSYGAILYKFSAFQPLLAVAFDFAFTSTSTINGADAVYFYFNSLTDPLTEDQQLVSGYNVGFSHYHQLATIMWTDPPDMPIAMQPLPLTAGTSYHVDIIFNAGNFSIYVDEGLLLTATDGNYGSRPTANHNLCGLGARCGAEFAQHKVYNLGMVED